MGDKIGRDCHVIGKTFSLVSYLATEIKTDMKKYFFTLIAALLVAQFSFAQEVAVPQNVLDQFAADFPNAENVKWEKDGKHFEVDFFQDEAWEAEYTKGGELVEKEREISYRELPEAIEAKLEAMGDVEPEEISIIEKGGILYYELEFEAEGDETEMRLDADGNEVPNDED